VGLNVINFDFGSSICVNIKVLGGSAGDFIINKLEWVEIN